MGLLDGFFSDDPRQQAQLALAMGLLSGSGGKGVGGFARDLGRAGIGAQSAYNQASLLKDKRAEEEQQRKFREMQMGQMQRGIDDQNFAQQLAPNFFQAQNAPADGTGPVAPPKADFAGYGQALAARNPQMGAQFMAMAPKPAQPQYKEVGGRLVRINPDNTVAEAYTPPEKPVYQPGQTRELKSGRRVITQEFDGKGWKTISTSDMDKPENTGDPRPIFDAERGVFITPPSPGRAPSMTPVPGMGPKMDSGQKKELQGIDAQIAVVDRALADAAKTPTAFSTKRGLATMAGAIPESVAGKFDTESEQQTRAFVFNTVSKVINERAGAAQSAQELARLRTFLPAETDSVGQVDSKLKAFKEYLKEQRSVYAAPAGSPPQKADPLGIR